MAVIMVEEAQCDCDDLAKAPSKPPPVLIARLRKWSLPTCVLGDELGRGSTGVVLRASLGDCETVVPVAVKVLREATSGCAMGQVKQRAERLRRVLRTPACATAWAHDAARRPDANACVQEIELIIADEEARLRAARSSKPFQAIHRLCKAFKMVLPLKRNSRVSRTDSKSTRRVERDAELFANYGTKFRFPGGCLCNFCETNLQWV
jgi:hypothetical protein